MISQEEQLKVMNFCCDFLDALKTNDIGILRLLLIRFVASSDACKDVRNEVLELSGKWGSYAIESPNKSLAACSYFSTGLLLHVNASTLSYEVILLSVLEISLQLDFDVFDLDKKIKNHNLSEQQIIKVLISYGYCKEESNKGAAEVSKR